MFEAPLADRLLRSEPFEVRMARAPDNDLDVFGPTMSRHGTLSGARDWRKRYYKSCFARQITPYPMVIVEVRHNCIVRYTGKRALAIYEEGGALRTENLRTELQFSLESALDATGSCLGETQIDCPELNTALEEKSAEWARSLAETVVSES